MDGIEYRLHTAFEDLIFGFNTMQIGDSDSVLVFDRERTLIHTLTDPDCNGGVRGVLEAWERASDTLRAPRLLGYLARLSVPAIWRRVGAICDHLSLTDLTSAAADALSTHPPVADVIDLVRGVAGGRLVMPWAVAVPW